MSLDWTTFFLEIVNFLVLVWILKRLLYRPVLAAIARRQAAIEKTLADAAARETAAQALERQYQNRLADWESEKEKLRSGVLEEVSRQRERLMAALQESLAQEREKARVLEERRVAEIGNRAREGAVDSGAQFTARLLRRMASPELEARIADLVAEDLPLLPVEQRDRIRAVGLNGGGPLKVTSAFPLPDARREGLARKLQEVLQTDAPVEFQEDSRLLAGLRVSAGPWVLHANLTDELRFFAEALRHGPA